MQFLWTFFIALFLCFVPMVLVLVFLLWKGKDRRKFSRAPFDDLPRRPAGEALRLKLDALNDEVDLHMTLLCVLPFFTGMWWFAQPVHGMPVLVIGLVLLTVGTVILAYRLLKLLRTMADHRLGYEGERYVGEELTRLINLGFEIYHDVPFEGYNIDHVLAGPRGVFIVETKTRRKPLDGDGKKQYQVQYDGKSLLWPKGNDSQSVEQSLRNAKSLAAWLSSACGERFWVTPILTIPGWMVERLVPADGLYVLNPKQIFGVCESLPEKLSEPQVRRLCHQLDQKCRLEVN